MLNEFAFGNMVICFCGIYIFFFESFCGLLLVADMQLNFIDETSPFNLETLPIKLANSLVLKSQVCNINFNNFSLM